MWGQSQLDDRYLRANQELEQRETQQRIDALEEYNKVREADRMLKTEAEKDRLRRELRQRFMTIIFISLLGLPLSISRGMQQQERDDWNRKVQDEQIKDIEKAFPRPSPASLPQCPDESIPCRLGVNDLK